LIDTTYHLPIVPGGSVAFKNIVNPIEDFIISHVPGGKAAVLGNTAPLVQECAISWCVKTVSASYAYGNYAETEIQTSQLDSTDAAQPWPDNEHYLPDFTLTRADPYAISGNQSTYGANNVTTRALWQSFEDFIPASWAYLDNGTETLMEVKALWEYEYIYSVAPAQFATPNTPYDNTNITDIVSGLATSLSNIIRRYSTNDSGKYATIPGVAYISQAQVQLRLAWAALPGGLLLFSLIFLLSTVWRTSEADKVGIWKTSALAMLFNGIGDDIQQQLGNKVKTGDARKRAKDMVVQLDDNE